MFVECLGVLLLLLSFIVYVNWCQSYWKRHGVYEYEHDFFFGTTKGLFLGKSLSFSEQSIIRYKKIKAANEKHAGLYMFLTAMYFPVDPGIIKNILQRDFSHFINHGVYHHPKDILTMNLFNVEGEMWRNLRVKLTPTFTSGKIKMMFETIVEKTEGLENIVSNYAQGDQTFAIKDVLGRFTTDVIGSCAFGIECNSLQDPDNLFRKYGKKVFEPQLLRLLIPVLLPWWLLGYLGFKSSGHDVTNFFTKIVKETIQYREKNGIVRKDFMHLLLQLKNNQTATNSEKTTNENDAKKGSHTLSENEIIAQCFIFFLAGFETSSTTMTFALLELAQYQDIQEKLRKEIQEVLAKHDFKITYDAVMQMTYLDKVVNETLRKFPPVSVLPRVCSKDYRVPGTDVVIEKGTRVQIPIWGLHTDPEYYPNPEVFNPENFSEENKAKRPDFTFLPFGEGPRMCIGLRFGVLQAKVGLISLIRKFNFTLNKKTHFPLEMEKASIVLQVKGDVWLDVTKV